MALALPAEARNEDNVSRTAHLALLVVAIGVGWRFVRYLLCFPIWGDEAMLLVNYPGRSYADLAGPLENCQVAPLLFHWAELTAIRLFGTSELAVRLPPLLACLASLALFWRLARLTLSPVASAFAVAVLSVSIWPATMGSLVKPYTFDLFFSLVLLLCAVEYHRRRTDWLLVALIVVIPIALTASYPAVFVAGAVSLGLLPLVVTQRRFSTWTLFCLYNAVLLATFAGHYLIVGKAQLASPVNGTSTSAEMAAYWNHGFPPAQPLSLIWWLFTAHTGQMAAYPLGAEAGGSIATVALCVVGVVGLWHKKRWLLGMFGCIFALGLVAAALRAYPYGASCRLAQHLAPVFCLLAGAGLAVLLTHRPRLTIVAFILLALIGVGGIVRDVVKPYRDNESRQARELADDDPIFRNEPAELSPVLRWRIVRRNAD